MYVCVCVWGGGTGFNFLDVSFLQKEVRQHNTKDTDKYSNKQQTTRSTNSLIHHPLPRVYRVAAPTRKLVWKPFLRIKSVLQETLLDVAVAQLEDWIVWWWCIPLFRAPADIEKRNSVLLKVRIFCFLPIGFGACCIRKRLKKKQVFHGIDKESVTDHLTGCAQRLEIMKMLGHGASSLPHGSFAHNECRRNPPELKVSNFLVRP